MIVPFEIKTVEAAVSATEVPEFLGRLLAGELPAFVVHDAWENVNDAMSAASPALAAQNLISRGSVTTFAHQAPSARRQAVIDAGGTMAAFARRGGILRPAIYGDGTTLLHADFPPTSSVVSAVVANTTEYGSAEASFLEPTESAVEAYLSRKLRFSLNPAKQLELLDAKLAMRPPNSSPDLLRKGLVDDEFFVPQVFKASLRPNSTVFFRSGGYKPLYHQFVSLELPRLSRVRIASVPKRIRRKF